MSLYEGMFIFPQSLVRENQKKALDEITAIIQKFEGKVEDIRVWAERPLSYEIKHVRDVSYVLCYFQAPPGAIGKIERSVLISDNILRCLILKPLKKLTLDDIKAGRTTQRERAMLREEAARQRLGQTVEQSVKEPAVL